MQRTQIYLTERQQRLIAQMALERESSKAAVIRDILDRALGDGEAENEDLAIIRSTSGICSDYPDWPEWLDSVRGRTADERLRSLGL
jgi:hypothetical protein